ncbi:MAG: NAD-glutamate dehydrogenase [Woeseia sp.]|nr:NAD-glutamate dehydrogenase [Woeseia sp.]
MAKKRKRRASDRSGKLIDEIVSSRPESQFLKAGRDTGTFLRHYFSDVPYEHIRDLTPVVMGKAAMSHLDFAKTRKPGTALLRILNPTLSTHGYESPFTTIEMVNDNMPFLVDSVSAAISRQKLAIHMTVHPILQVQRDRRGKFLKISGDLGGENYIKESFIRLSIDRETDTHRLKILEQEIVKVLSDVRIAVCDWQQMRDKMLATASELSHLPTVSDKQVCYESEKLLRWLADDHFTFLGFREHKLRNKAGKTYLSPVKGSGLGLLATDERGGNSVELTKAMQKHTHSKDLLIITKANSRSTVHRYSYLDYIGVKQFDNNGKVTGEKRFIGLFTSVAYNERPRNIPLLRLKVERVLEDLSIDPSGHRGKALTNILENYPRDELFQSSITDLVRTSLGILNLQDRGQVKIFLRRDAFRRFLSCIIYVPKEKYTTAVRRRVEEILQDELDGISVDSSVQIADSPLARMHTIVRTSAANTIRTNTKRIEKRIEATVIDWRDHLRVQLVKKFGEDEGLSLFRKYGEGFSPAYEGETEPRIACLDIKRIDGLLKTEHDDYLLLHKPSDCASDRMNLRTFRQNEPLALSDVLPFLENMGTPVRSERPYSIQLPDGNYFWIQDFELQFSEASKIDIELAAARFQDGFRQALSGETESDNFNHLILSAGLEVRQITLVRCYAKYILQLGIPFSQNLMEEVLVSHSKLAGKLVHLFELQFDPKLGGKRREEKVKACKANINRRISRVKSLDQDRILSAFSSAISATVRTNFFQDNLEGRPKTYISIKLNPTKIPEVPIPKPKSEIFVYSTHVEGIHLRAGEFARGGIRWSNRREDFRTEVLGLMKAQVVKNSIIVPTGAKGGFFPKKLPLGDPKAISEESIACYRTFICGLLDITDNVVNEKVITPDKVVRRDDDDPYLVVAADKGTATFSDTANDISSKYKFWLDDAFASGGSTGYDHKKMGITARGAWEAVKRHFQEKNINIQKESLSVIGIGDMGGDVFGNGMLLSGKIKLLAAFNHMHIFLDPDPDIAASFRERKRLFREEHSGWEHYREEIISKGGGVFSREAKRIRLSPEARRMLGINVTTIQPLELIRAILTMEVDLFWNGGIGTYVKSSSETNAEVGDRANDIVRVNANDLRCKVVAEGGNLGFTQQARIEYSLNAGRINTDFIDNSAGVDTSDREVNIKILMGAAEKDGRLTREQRDEFLQKMTIDIKDLVLRDNYLQTQSISLMETRAPERLSEMADLIRSLEKTGILDRELESLPDDLAIEERRERMEGLTRPESSIVLSYAKIALYNGLECSDESLDDFFAIDLTEYFPHLLHSRFGDLIPQHRLIRQILATLIANNIVNRMGPTFVHRIQTETGAKIETVARAYFVAREICKANEIWSMIEKLDHKVPTSDLHRMMFEIERVMRHTCSWVIDRYGDELDIAKSIAHFGKPISSLHQSPAKFLAGNEQERLVDDYIRQGVPKQLAGRITSIHSTRGYLDIADLTKQYSKNLFSMARTYAAIGDRFGIVWMHQATENLKVQGRWQALARSNLRGDLYRIRRDFLIVLLQDKSRKKIIDIFEYWVQKNSVRLKKFDTILAEIQLRDDLDFETLSAAVQELRKLIND